MGKRDQPGGGGNKEDIANNYSRDEGGGLSIRRIRREYEAHREGNNRLHPGLKIADVRWISKIKRKKDYLSLIMEVVNAEYTNYIIIEGIVYRYDLKLIEVYDRAVRVI